MGSKSALNYNPAFVLGEVSKREKGPLLQGSFKLHSIRWCSWTRITSWKVRWWTQSGLEYQIIPYWSFFSTNVLFFTHIFRYLLNIAIWISPIFDVMDCILNFPLDFLRYPSSCCFILCSELFVIVLVSLWLPIDVSKPRVLYLPPFFFSSFQIFPHRLQWRVSRRLYTFSLAQTGHFTCFTLHSFICWLILTLSRTMILIEDTWKCVSGYLYLFYRFKNVI